MSSLGVLLDDVSVDAATVPGDRCSSRHLNINVPGVRSDAVDAVLFRRLGVDAQRIRIGGNAHYLDRDDATRCPAGTIGHRRDVIDSDDTLATSRFRFRRDDADASASDVLLRCRLSSVDWWQSQEERHLEFPI